MEKHLCDWCESEIKDEIEITVSKNNDPFSVFSIGRARVEIDNGRKEGKVNTFKVIKSVQLCQNCIKKYNKIIDKANKEIDSMGNK